MKHIILEENESARRAVAESQLSEWLTVEADLIERGVDVPERNRILKAWKNSTHLLQ